MSTITLDTPESLSALPFLEKSEALTSTEKATDAIGQSWIGKDSTIAAMGYGMRFEEVSTKKLHKMEADANRQIAAIDLLLDLSQELASAGETELKLSDKALQIIDSLKKEGISVMEDGTTLSKEQLITLKSNISVRIDKLRTQVQQIFTKIQTIIQYMSSVNDVIKQIISKNAEFHSKVIDRSIKR